MLMKKEGALEEAEHIAGRLHHAELDDIAQVRLLHLLRELAEARQNGDEEESEALEMELDQTSIRIGMARRKREIAHQIADLCQRLDLGEVHVGMVADPAFRRAQRVIVPHPVASEHAQ